MSFRPGLPVQMTRQIYTTTPMPSGAMMVRMAPVRPVAMVPVSQMMVRPVIRPVITQSQAFISTMHPRALAHVVTNQPQIIQTANPQVWIQTETRKATFFSPSVEVKKETPSSHTAPTESYTETVTEPAVTVFVGNITDRASDTLIRQILMKCGSVYAWKRVQGPSGKLQAFGFCEYKDPESALRAIHILHDFLLGDKKLLVKVDAKTQERIDDWKKEKKLETDEKGSIKLEGVEEALTGIQALVQGYSNELAIPKPTSSEKEDIAQILKPDSNMPESSNVEENLNGLQLEEDEKNFISKEIRFFRESQKQQDERLKWLKEERSRGRDDYFRSKPRIDGEDRLRFSRRGRRSYSISPARSPIRRRSRTPNRPLLIRRRSTRSRSRSRSRSRRRTRSSSRRRSRSRTPRRRSRSLSSRRRSRSKSRSYRRSRSYSRRRSRSRTRSSRRRSRSRSRSSRRRSRSYTPRRRSRTRSRSRYRSRSRSYSRRRKSYSRSPSPWSSYDDSGAEEERKKFQEKIEQKQVSFQKRLEAVEILEKRIKVDHMKLEQELASDRRNMIKDGKILREFLADYDDEKQDCNYYVGESLAQRLKEREEEMKQDEIDRKKEKEEVELLRERLVMENHPDPEGLINEVMTASYNVWKPLVTSSESHLSDLDRNTSSKSSSDLDSSDEDNKFSKSTSSASVNHNYRIKSNIKTKFKPISSAESSNHNSPVDFDKLKHQSSESNRSIKLSSKRRKFQVSSVFNQDDEDERSKSSLPPLSTERKPNKIVSKRKKSDDKRRSVRALIDRIPTKKDDLFDYKIDWKVLDATLMEKRVRPWINKKIVEYVGEEEPTLVEFICNKITSKTAPTRILEDISIVLDDEADVFIVKLWRLLIYETEAKKEGLTKL